MYHRYAMALAVVLLATPHGLYAADRPALRAANNQKLAMASHPTTSSGGDADLSRATSDRLTEQDARDWLARYKSAWDARDVASLSALGVIREEQQTDMRRVLAEYKRLDVSVTNESISLEGKRALLSFDRTDTDETGKELRHPRQTVLLERSAAGVVSTWRARVEK